MTRKTRIANLNFRNTRICLKCAGVSLTRKDGEFRVNLTGAPEATAYYTNDLDDAFNTGLRMATHKIAAGLSALQIQALLQAAQKEAGQ